MVNEKTTAGEITVDVRAKLSVDFETFAACMTLISIYAKNHDLKGMVVDFRDNWRTKDLRTEKALEAALSGKEID